MELIKKTLDVAEANGWYLLQTEKRYWLENTVDDENNPVTEERSEVLCKKGVQVNDIIMSMLQENGIEKVRVSNVPLLGQQDKNLNLWETVLRVRTSKTNNKQTFIATGDCPSAAEQFVAEWFEVNIDGTCEFITVKSQDYKKVIKLYETEADELQKDGTAILWFKCQVYSMLDSDDDGESHNAGSKNLLVQASSFENAIKAIKAVMNRSEFDAIYNTFKSLQELKLEEVFVPDENVSYYSESDID
jgi:hypothetical protein